MFTLTRALMSRALLTINLWKLGHGFLRVTVYFLWRDFEGGETIKRISTLRL